MVLYLKEIFTLLAFSSSNFNSLYAILDQISFFMIYPWATALSKVTAYYFIQDSFSYKSWWSEAKEKLIIGPFLFVFVIAFTPIGIPGYLLWIFICTFLPRKKYSYLELCPKKISPQKTKETITKNVFTLGSGNVLLANETFSRWNNNRNPMARSKMIGTQLLQQSSSFLDNLNSSKKDDIVTSIFPDVDILCIQGVWERHWAATMIDHLGLKYSYFIHDVGEHSLKSNLCLFGSGLFVASKYPIVAVEFQPFEYRTRRARIFSYGVLCLKIRINQARVAYVANLHTQANQEKHDILYNQLTEILSAVNAFRLKTQLPDDGCIFDAICGDFNFDNLAPRDLRTQEHPLFNQYFDVCCKKRGEDHDWTVGTALRQLRMHDPEVSSPDNLRNVLIDDNKRTQYLLDADVLEVTDHSTVEQGLNGEVKVPTESREGKRRVDRILLRRDSSVKALGYAFSSILAGLTDHIPVALSFKVPSK